MTRMSRKTSLMLALLSLVWIFLPACDGRVMMAGHFMTFFVSSAMLFAVLNLDRVRKD